MNNYSDLDNFVGHSHVGRLEKPELVEGPDGLELVDVVLERKLDLGVEETILRMVVVATLKFQQKSFIKIASLKNHTLLK